jgi:adenylate kinase
MIVVGVALDTVNQIEAHLITRSYEGLTGPRRRPHPRAPPARGLRGQGSHDLDGFWGPPGLAKARRRSSSASASASRRSPPATCSARPRRPARSIRSYLAIMDAGGLVPDEAVIGSSTSASTQADAGRASSSTASPARSPRPRRWASCSPKRGKIDRVVQLDVPRSMIEERTIHRRTDKRSGQIYHLKYNPPPPDAELEHRADDQPEAVKQAPRRVRGDDRGAVPYYEKGAPAAGRRCRQARRGDRRGCSRRSRSRRSSPQRAQAKRKGS